MMSSTQDVRFSADRIDQGRQLVTKLWNATRLVIDRGGRAGVAAPEPRTLADRWIASRVARAVDEAADLTARFEMSQLAKLVYELVFDDYCDWYLELLKAGEATPEMAGFALEQILALAHPLMPFVTEECWSRMPGAEGLMAVHAPPVAPGQADPDAEAEMAAVQEVVTALRAYRSRRDLPPPAPGSRWTRRPAAAVAALDRSSRPTRRRGRPSSRPSAGRPVDQRRGPRRGGRPGGGAGRLEDELADGRGRARPRAAQARRRALRGAGPGAPGRGRAREGGSLRGRAGGAGRPHRRAGVTAGRPASGSRGWRSWECASAWSASGRCSPRSATRSDAAPASTWSGRTARVDHPPRRRRAGGHRAAGRGRTCRRTSSDWTERVQLDGAPVGEAAFAAAATDVRDAAEALPLEEGDTVTQFEALTAIGFRAFAAAGVDATAVEAGLGGRWDATNVLPDDAAVVLTNMTLEHTEFLGDTEAAIAAEKLAVAADGRTVVVGPLSARGPRGGGRRVRPPGPAPAALRRGPRGPATPRSGVEVRTPRAVYTGLPLALRGAFQRANLRSRWPRRSWPWAGRSSRGRCATRWAA